jgi:hypothetical protein
MKQNVKKQAPPNDREDKIPGLYHRSIILKSLFDNIMEKRLPSCED